jgi:hypothetical protein
VALLIFMSAKFPWLRRRLRKWGLRSSPRNNVEKIGEAVIRTRFYFRKGVRMLQLWNKRTIGYQWRIVCHVRRRRNSVWSKLHFMVLRIYLLRRYIIRKWALKASAFLSNVCWRCFYVPNSYLNVYFCWHNFVCEVKLCYYSIVY